MKNPLSSETLSTSSVFAKSRAILRLAAYSIIFTALTVSLPSCKKQTHSAPSHETQLPGENYEVSLEQIKEHNWQIVERWDYDNATRRLWKLRGITKAGEQTNYFILFTKVPDTIYWKPGFQKLDILSGIDVADLIETSSKPATSQN